MSSPILKSVRTIVCILALAFVAKSASAADIAVLDSSVYTRDFFSRHYVYCGGGMPNTLGADEYKRYMLGWEYVLDQAKASNPSQYAYIVIHDSDLTAAGLAPFRVLILSNDVALSDDQSKAVHKWVIGGGHLLATFGSGYKDIVDDARQDDGLKLQHGGTGSLHELWHDPLNKAFSTRGIDPAHPEYGTVDIRITNSSGPAAGIGGTLNGYGSFGNLLTQRPENNPDVYALFVMDPLLNWKRPQPAILASKSGKGLTVYYAFAPELIVSLEFDLAGHCPGDANYPPVSATNLFTGRSAQLRPLMKSTIDYLLSR